MSEQNVVETPSEQFDGGDFEGDFESSDNGSQPAPGMGQSKSSRRRRRKRKNKVAGAPGEPQGASIVLEGGADFAEGEAPAPFVMEGETIAAAGSNGPRKPQGSSQNTGQQAGQQQGQGQGGKRWKKKFRDRERRPARNENPGNDFRGDSNNNSGGSSYSNNGGGYRPDNFGNSTGGFKRKGKGGGQQQRKERGFVGPMDHSYRESEDGGGPPSTISLGGRRGGHRHHGDNQPIDHNMPRAVPIPEGAQTHIYFFIEELFFQAKIQETARKLGVKVAFLKGDDKDALAELTSGEERDRPALIVFDLNNANAKPLTLIPKLKTKLKKSASIIGFLSHLQGDLKAKAAEVGCDTVMPRSAFSQNLPNLLRRYGIEDEEEVNFNR